MKSILSVVLAFASAISAFADDSKTNAAPPEIATNKLAQAVVTLPASAGTITAPLVLTNGCIAQPEQTELADGGKAVFSFTVTNAGNYVITAVVNAPDESSNSFFVNVDAPPDDTMIWDMDVTNGFEERTVSWRGNGDANGDEISPKVFTLSAGAHKLIFVGREPMQLKSISIRPAN